MARPLRIGIDGSCLANRRGFGRFTRRLLGALAEVDTPHEYVVFVDRPSAEVVTVPPRFRTQIVEVREAPSRAARASGRRGLADLLAMGRAVSRAGLDVMYFPTSYSFFPVWNRGRTVVTVHDTLPLSHPGLVFPTFRGRLAWRAKEWLAVRSADRVLTVSEASRRDIVRWYGLAPEAVGVIPEAPDPVFANQPESPGDAAILARCGLEPGGRFLLYVGGLAPHKNLPRLVEAFALGAPADTKLVLVGDHGDVFHTDVPAIRRAIAGAGLDHRVSLPGFVEDEALAVLYSRAYALAQPSLMEGFGLPPVEAMACGTPVLSSRAGSMPEVVGDAGLFFDPSDVGEMAATIGRLLDDQSLRDRLAGIARDRAGRLTWRAAALRLVEEFQNQGFQIPNLPRRKSQEPHGLAATASERPVSSSL